MLSEPTITIWWRKRLDQHSSFSSTNTAMNQYPGEADWGNDKSLTLSTHRTTGKTGKWGPKERENERSVDKDIADSRGSDRVTAPHIQLLTPTYAQTPRQNLQARLPTRPGCWFKFPGTPKVTRMKPMLRFPRLISHCSRGIATLDNRLVWEHHCFELFRAFGCHETCLQGQPPSLEF